MPAVPHSGAAIEVSGLVVRYGDLVAVDGVEFSAHRGEVVALLGRNGAGKTSTVESLEGYRRRSAGSVRVLGLDPGVHSETRALASRIGVMLQRGGVYPGMGPGEAVRLFASYYDDPEQPDALLARVGLTAVARTPWRRLSGGEQQRLSLALALVGRPEVAFLDEPTAGVDPQGRIAIRSEIARLRAVGVCVLLTTHELEEAERVADTIVIVDRGRVVASGTLAELTATGNAGLRFEAPPGIDLAALSAALDAPVREQSPGHYTVEAENAPATTAALAAWMAERDLPLTSLRAGRESLEEVFLRLTGELPENSQP
ncbi:MAG TPA: ABC transporter ATP-binding protein [Acidimicrobiales bacterium]|nr:ABC transporter ATP-binding protein [Acidimicrobiales bacterium]